jgi:integrase
VVFLNFGFQRLGVDEMASIKRKTVTRPLPSDAVLNTKRRRATSKELRDNPTAATIVETVATWKDRSGKKRSAVVVVGDDGAQRVRLQSETYYAKYRDGDGIVREVATGCRDLQAARTKLAELQSIADKIKVGALTTLDLQIGDHSRTPLSVHVAEYIADLKARGVNADRIKTSETYLNADCDGCGFRWLRDLNAEKLRQWLRTQSDMSAATYNWHSALWVAFGWWLTGRRIENKKRSLTGERRLATNPFDGFGKRDEQADRKRVARSLTIDEMRRLLEQARKRPLEDAMRVNTGPNKGAMTAKVTDERRSELERLGFERALIYKTAILTGLRLNELRTLRVADLSFGDVPFLVLRAANEKNRKGSTVPLRSDLAAELRGWTQGKSPESFVLNVPSGLLRILNRDLIAAGIDKIDERKGRVHLHALRHSTGTHLSTAGVAPRTAQAVMRHSDLALTMRTYTDERLLNSAGAVELLPSLPLGTPNGSSLVAPTVAPATGKTCQTGATTDKIGKVGLRRKYARNVKKPRASRGFKTWSRGGSNSRPLHCERSALPTELRPLLFRRSTSH